MRPQDGNCKTRKKYCRASNEERGRHLIATEKINAGSLIFMESPLLCQQSLVNTGAALTCRQCKGFIGGSNIGLKFTCGKISRQDLSDFSTDDSSSLQERIIACRQGCGELYCSIDCQNMHWELAGHCLLCTGSIIDKDDDDISSEKKSQLYYCNKECLQKQHPLLQFKVHAVQTNEIFLLVADWIATVICRYFQRLLQLTSSAHETTNDNHTAASSPADDATFSSHFFLKSYPFDNEEEKVPLLTKVKRRLFLEQVLEPFTDFTMNLWWSISSLDQVATLQSLCQESSKLLKEAFFASTYQHHAEIRDIIWKISIQDCANIFCSSTSFGRIIGSFEQNAIGIRARNPLCFDIFDRQLRERNNEEIVQCLVKAGFICTEGADCCTSSTSSDHDDSSNTSTNDNKDENTTAHHDDFKDYSVNDVCNVLNQLYIRGERKLDDNDPTEEGDDLDYIFAPLDGTAMFSIACKMNHSCQPNAIVRYARNHWYHPLKLQCISISEIQKGEELCISYIDEHTIDSSSVRANIKERWKQLESYGFQCNCEKCILEQKQVHKSPIDASTENTEHTFSCDEDAEEESSSFTEAYNDNEAEKILQNRFSSFIVNSTNEMLGRIPEQIYKSSALYAISAGHSALRVMQQHLQQNLSILQRTIEALESGNLVMCRIHGSQGEATFYGTTELLEAYHCCAIAASIGYANEGSMTDAISLLNKAENTLPRSAVLDLLDYIHLFR